MKPENFMFGLGIAGMILGISLAIPKHDDETPTQQAPTPGASVRYSPYVFLDYVTGCQYLSTQTSFALTPRVAADGRTHMGCKAVKP